MLAKRFLVIFISVLMIFTLLSGCRRDGDTTSTTTTRTGTTAGTTAPTTTEAEKYPRDADGIPDLGGITITQWIPLQAGDVQIIENMAEFGAAKYLEEKFNVKLEFIHPPVGQDQDAFSIMISSRPLPDIVQDISRFYAGGLNAALKDGVIWQIDDDLIGKYAPNFKANILSIDDYRLAAYNDDGQLIHFGTPIRPGIEYKDVSLAAGTAFIGPLIRSDYLAATGLSVPVTISDWYKVLTAFRDNGVEIPYGWASSIRDQDQEFAIFAGAYGVKGDFMIKEDGSATFGPMEPAYKEYLAEMNKWYEEGLINQDFANHTKTDSVHPLMAAGKVGAITTHLFDAYSRFTDIVTKEDPDAVLIPTQFPVLNEGDPLPRFRQINQGFLVTSRSITSDSNDPIACMIFLDMSYNEEVNKRLALGIEGVHYTTDEDGFISRITKTPNDEGYYDFAINAAVSRFRGMENGFLYEKELPVWQIPEAFRTWRQAGYDGNIPGAITFTQEESDIIARYQTDLKTYANEMFLKFVVGIEPIENFDKFVEQLKQMRVVELVEVYQAALDRFMARS